MFRYNFLSLTFPGPMCQDVLVSNSSLLVVPELPVSHSEIAKGFDSEDIFCWSSNTIGNSLRRLGRLKNRYSWCWSLESGLESRGKPTSRIYPQRIQFMGKSVCQNMFPLASFTELQSIAFKYLCLMSLVRSWFKDERIRQKIAALDADDFAAMGYPRAGREEALNLSRLIAWVSGEVQCTSIATD